jgi:hypothetical protein
MLQAEWSKAVVINTWYVCHACITVILEMQNKFLLSFKCKYLAHFVVKWFEGGILIHMLTGLWWEVQKERDH